MKRLVLIGLLVLASIVCFGQVKKYEVFASCVSEFNESTQQWSDFSDPVPDEGTILINLDEDQVVVSCCDITITYQITGKLTEDCADMECAFAYSASSNKGQECLLILDMTPIGIISVTIGVNGTAVMMYVKEAGMNKTKDQEVKKFKEIDI